MKPNFSALVFACAGLIFASSIARADVVEMQNGDRYNGKVLSLSDNALILQNEVLGKMTLPRSKVAAINFGFQLPKTNTFSSPANSAISRVPKAAAQPLTNFPPAQLIGQSNLIQQVQKEFLAGADAAAQDKFNELVSGLVSGKLSIEDIRREARTSADQMRALRKDVGEDAGFAIDGYLAILDQFLREAPAASVSPTNAPGIIPKRQPDADGE